MKKLLVVSSCGVLLIVILGASNTRFNAREHKKLDVLPVSKCIESVEDKTQKTDCMEEVSKLRSELFLRSLKKKERRIVV